MTLEMLQLIWQQSEKKYLSVLPVVPLQASHEKGAAHEIWNTWRQY